MTLAIKTEHACRGLIHIRVPGRRSGSVKHCNCFTNPVRRIDMDNPHHGVLNAPPAPNGPRTFLNKNVEHLDDFLLKVDYNYTDDRKEVERGERRRSILIPFDVEFLFFCSFLFIVINPFAIFPSLVLSHLENDLWLWLYSLIHSLLSYCKTLSIYDCSSAMMHAWP